MVSEKQPHQNTQNCPTRKPSLIQTSSRVTFHTILHMRKPRPSQLSIEPALTQLRRDLR